MKNYNSTILKTKESTIPHIQKSRHNGGVNIFHLFCGFMIKLLSWNCCQLSTETT